MELVIKGTNGEDLAIPLEPGKPLYVVGPNGSGKSALIQHAATQLGAGEVRRVSAHRQTWLESSAINMSPLDKRRFDEHHVRWITDPEYRWREYDANGRLSAVLFELMAMQGQLARRLMHFAYEGDFDAISDITEVERPIFVKINELLDMAGMAVSILSNQGEEIVAVHGKSRNTYSMAQMSDGERNAVLLAAEVLTAEKGTVLIIDEPERHLHRAIIEPLLSALFSQRPDCPFVVSTHELALPLADPEAPVLALRSCSWNGDRAEAWDAELLTGEMDLPEDLKRAILGSRRRILFVEGIHQGIDALMYGALFPSVSVIPVGSCDQVIDSTAGLRYSEALHEVEAFGLIDADNRSDDEKVGLKEKGVFALACYSVESIYYCLDAIRAVAEWQSISLGDGANNMLKRAEAGALKALRAQGVPEMLAARRCERRVREQMHLPTWKNILEEGSYSVNIDTASWHQEELNCFNDLLAANDLEGIIARYPFRQSDVIEEIIKPLQLTRNNYRKTLLSRIRQDSELAEKLRQRVGPLSTQFGALD